MYARKQMPQEERIPLRVWVPLPKEPEEKACEKPKRDKPDPRVDFFVDFNV